MDNHYLETLKNQVVAQAADIVSDELRISYKQANKIIDSYCKEFGFTKRVHEPDWLAAETIDFHSETNRKKIRYVV
jgi:hypothetical protein